MLRTPGLNVVLEVYLCPQTETLIPEKKGIKEYFCVISYWIFHFICCLWVHALHDHGVVAEIGIPVGLQVWGMTYSTLHVAPFITVILESFGRRRQTPLALPQPCSTFFCVSNHRKQNGFDHVRVMGPGGWANPSGMPSVLAAVCRNSSCCLGFKCVQDTGAVSQSSHFQRCWTSP